MSKFDESTSRPCCSACNSQIRQLTEDLARLEEGFAIDNVQCLELKVYREDNQQLRSIIQQLRSILDANGIRYGIPYG
jgi:hypothetical protein